MDQIDRKARVRAYKQTPRPVGIFCVRNTAADRLLIGASKDLPGMLNRQRFQLEMNSHSNKSLQSDWNEIGPGFFVFEELDRLDIPEDPGYDPSADLKILEQLWRERLSAAGRLLYG